MTDPIVITRDLVADAPPETLEDLDNIYYYLELFASVFGEIDEGSGGIKWLNDSGTGLSKGDVVGFNSTTNKLAKADASTPIEAVAIVSESVSSGNYFEPIRIGADGVVNVAGTETIQRGTSAYLSNTAGLATNSSGATNRQRIGVFTAPPGADNKAYITCTFERMIKNITI